MLVAHEDAETGASVTSLEHNGRKWPPRTVTTDCLDRLDEFVARPDDVWIVSFPKCGTHWVWDIVSMLQRSEAVHHKCVKEDFMLEFNPLEHYEKMESPRVLNSHLWRSQMPASVFKAKSKLIHVVRNPKDATVSFHNHHRGIADYKFDGEFKAFFNLTLADQIEYGTWFSYIKNWWDNSHEDPNVLWVYYEDMIQDLRSNVKRISAFLGIAADDKLVDAITEACTFANMKAAKLAGDLEYYSWNEGFKHGMYRKGKVGDWKNWFTVTQSEFFDRIYEKELLGYDDLKARIKFEL